MADGWKDSISPARILGLDCSQLGGHELNNNPDESSWSNPLKFGLFLDCLPERDGYCCSAYPGADDVKICGSLEVLVDENVINVGSIVEGGTSICSGIWGTKLEGILAYTLALLVRC